jgi:predicted nuclease of restriction endonuclease-like (RecB) superfamily
MVLLTRQQADSLIKVAIEIIESHMSLPSKNSSPIDFLSFQRHILERSIEDTLEVIANQLGDTIANISIDQNLNEKFLKNQDP